MIGMVCVPLCDAVCMSGETRNPSIPPVQDRHTRLPILVPECSKEGHLERGAHAKED